MDGFTRAVDPGKVLILKNWEAPKLGKLLESFLGFVKSMRDYVPFYADCLGPLERIRKLKKITPSNWGEQQQAAFEKIKNLIEKVPILSQPRWDLEFIMATDASQFGVGAVLYQQVDEKNIHIKFDFVDDNSDSIEKMVKTA